jgi:hypothetical protein
MQREAFRPSQDSRPRADGTESWAWRARTSAGFDQADVLKRPDGKVAIVRRYGWARPPRSAMQASVHATIDEALAALPAPARRAIEQARGTAASGAPC